MSEAGPLRFSKGAVLLAVQAQPGAKQEGLAGLHDGRLRVRTKVAPEGGKANADIAALVAAAFSLPKRSVSVVSGAGSRRKELALEGLSLADARERLDELLLA